MKPGIIFMITKAGYLFMFDVQTASMLMRTKVAVREGLQGTSNSRPMAVDREFVYIFWAPRASRKRKKRRIASFLRSPISMWLFINAPRP